MAEVVIKAFKTMAILRRDMELSSTMQIGLQEWITMITTKMKKMMTKNTIMKEPKITNTRKKSKHKNRLTLMRLSISSPMQDRIRILSYT